MKPEDRSVKTNPTMPDALSDELTRMRRVASEFVIVRVGPCRFCDNSPNAFFLSHPLCESVAAWCSRHGFLYFETGIVTPTGYQQPERKPRMRKAA